VGSVAYVSEVHAASVFRIEDPLLDQKGRSKNTIRYSHPLINQFSSRRNSVFVSRFKEHHLQAIDAADWAHDRVPCCVVCCCLLILWMSKTRCSAVSLWFSIGEAFSSTDSFVVIV
jgi:hypothetical protein